MKDRRDKNGCFIRETIAWEKEYQMPNVSKAETQRLQRDEEKPEDAKQPQITQILFWSSVRGRAFLRVSQYKPQGHF